MIETTRLHIVPAEEADIGTIIEIESHKDNRDFLWIGTYEQHKSEINDPNHRLFIFKSKEDAAIVGYSLIRLDFKSEIFELRRIAITKKGMGYGKEVMKALGCIVTEFLDKIINPHEDT